MELGRSLSVFPLIAGEQWIGLVAMMADEPVELRESQVRQIQSLVGQASAVVQSLSLLQQTEARARQERVLREVTARLRGSTDPDIVMRTAVRELSGVLGRNVLIRLGGGGGTPGDGGERTSNGERDSMEGSA